MNDDEHRAYLRKITSQLEIIVLLLSVIMLANVNSCDHTSDIERHTKK